MAVPELPSLETLFEYLPGAVVRFAPRTEERVSLWLEQVREAYESDRRLPSTTPGEALPDAAPLLFGAGVAGAAATARGAAVDRGGCAISAGFGLRGPNRSRTGRFATSSQHSASTDGGSSRGAAERDLKLLAKRAKPVLAAEPRRAPGWQKVREAAAGETLLLRVDFDAGFVLPAEDVAVITAADLLGSRAAHEVPMELRHGSADGATETAFRMDDAVIHSEHGIGLLRGIETVGGDGMPAEETIRIEYAGGATLMVPVQEIGLLWRYGADPEAVSLDRLDGENWKKRRAEVGRRLPKPRMA